MKIKRLANTSVVTQVRRMTIDGMVFSPPGDFDELLDSLCEVDGSGGACVVYDSGVKKVFEKAGLIKSNARGGCYGTPKLKQHRQALIDAFYETKQLALTKPKKHKHRPIWSTLLLADASDGTVDVHCSCGLSGSTVVEPKGIQWDEGSRPA